ncbi:MAG: class A beta-lactamase-related serine hydrolase [Xanthomonadales bacterium]|nr:class A beta-lactamase-related serine hydrolase [Xanthomonadales bacterium]
MRTTILMLLLAMTTACEKTATWEGSLDSLLASRPDQFLTVTQNRDKYRVQVIYTQIDRDAGNQPTFRTFVYNVNPTVYFYPASTVKLPVAALALEKLNRLNQPGLDRDTTMMTGSDATFQTVARADETSVTGLPSVGNYIRKIILVSDNDAFNRLYEFMGQQEINQRLSGMGYFDSRIIHRLESSLSEEENRWTNPVQFLSDDDLVYEQAAVYNEHSFRGAKPEKLGVAEIVDGKRLERPKDFAGKNAYALLDQHEFIKNLVFPQSTKPQKRLDLSEDDYRFLYRYMSMYPGESGIEAYSNSDDYPQGYVKFLMYGGDASVIPPNIRIFNKVGDAYGFLTDTAYIVDFKNNIEFILSATIYTNENQTFNDDNYEYDDIGLPFLKNLGQAIYEIELKRQREHTPDLSRFRFPDRDY